jgi:hypothetical protein
VKLDYTNSDGSLAGSRFFLSYSGSAPSAANCATLAGDIGTAWESDISGLVSGEWSLTEVDVEDIATLYGLSGTSNTSHAGARTGTLLPAQVAANVEFDIARRYRGGKPRIFWPAGTDGDLADQAHWTSGFITSLNTGTAGFFTAIAALSVGSMGTLEHVNLSYYYMFTNVTNSSGRTRAAPKYRDTALVDPITGYSAKGLLGSQRRRRSSTAY